MIDFVKMNGLGNDFVVLDSRTRAIPMTPARARRIADRRFGVGCDQLIVLEPSDRGDAFMRIYNPDGSESGACGNATRCIGERLMQESGAQTAFIETCAGLLVATASGAGVTVDMGPPALNWEAIPLAHPVADTGRVAIDVSSFNAGLPGWFSAVSMGNPHAVFFVEDVDAHQIERIGPLLETHGIFPERANISFVCVKSPTHLVQRVWERGAGLTLACGSGACAAAVAAIRAGLTGSRMTVTLPGGDLTIEQRADGHVQMTGGTATAFSGVLHPSLLAEG